MAITNSPPSHMAYGPYEIDTMYDAIYDHYKVRVSQSGMHSSHVIDRRDNWHPSRFVEQHERLKKTHPSYQYTGPTNEDLNKYPAVREAFREFRMIYKLSTGKDLE